MRTSFQTLLFVACSLLASAEARAHGDDHQRSLTRGERECAATLANVTCGKIFSCGTPKAGVTFDKCQRSFASQTRKSLRKRSARKGLQICSTAISRIQSVSCSDIGGGGPKTKR